MKLVWSNLVGKSSVRYFGRGGPCAEFPYIPLSDLLALLDTDHKRYGQVAQYLAALDLITRLETDEGSISLVPGAIALEVICEGAAAGLAALEAVRVVDAGLVQASAAMAFRFDMPLGDFLEQAARFHREQMTYPLPGAMN